MDTTSVSSNDSDKAVFSVTRGSELRDKNDKWTTLKSLVEGCDVGLEELLDYINSINDSKDYSSIFYRNTFKADSPIALVSVGFFGPHKQEKAIYEVFLELEDYNSQTVLATNSLSIKAMRGEIFTAEFETPVPLQANVYYTIKFQLDGPDTGVCDASKSITRCCVQGINFVFLTGSQQMPVLSFQSL